MGEVGHVFAMQSLKTSTDLSVSSALVCRKVASWFFVWRPIPFLLIFISTSNQTSYRFLRRLLSICFWCFFFSIVCLQGIVQTLIDISLLFLHLMLINVWSQGQFPGKIIDWLLSFLLKRLLGDEACPTSVFQMSYSSLLFCCDKSHFCCRFHSCQFLLL